MNLPSASSSPSASFSPTGAACQTHTAAARSLRRRPPRLTPPASSGGKKMMAMSEAMSESARSLQRAPGVRHLHYRKAPRRRRRRGSVQRPPQGAPPAGRRRGAAAAAAQPSWDETTALRRRRDGRPTISLASGRAAARRPPDTWRWERTVTMKMRGGASQMGREDRTK